MTITKNNLPKLKSTFIGRERDVKALLSVLSIESRVWLAVIWGMAGVGKTTLAQYVAENIKSKNVYDAIVWTSCKEEFIQKGHIKKVLKSPILTNINGLFTEIAKVLKINTTGLTILKKQEAIREVLKTRKVLIIIDNLESMDESDATEVLMFLRNMLPSPSKAMITSRYQYTGQGEYTLKLDTFSVQEVKNLIRTELTSKNQVAKLLLSENDMYNIYLKTGGIPLAVKWILGQFKSSKKKNIPTILEHLDTNKVDELLEYCFQQSYYWLKPDSRKIINGLAKNSHPLAFNQIKFLTELNEYKLSLGVEQLLAMSLVEHSSDTGEYSLLPLTRSFVLKQISREE